MTSLGSFYLKVCLLMLAGIDSVSHSIDFYYSAKAEQAIWSLTRYAKGYKLVTDKLALYMWQPD